MAKNEFELRKVHTYFGVTVYHKNTVCQHRRFVLWRIGIDTGSPAYERAVDLLFFYKMLAPCPLRKARLTDRAGLL